MKLHLLSFFTLAVFLLAEVADAKTIAWWPPHDKCCKKGQFCCGRDCLPQWKWRFMSSSKCPIFKDGCCKPEPVDPCKEKPFQSGFCKAAIPRYSFNPKTQQCELFSWGGCGGNSNNFVKEADCIKKCDAKPPADCCKPGYKCCGTGCIPDNAQTLVDCGKPKCCKPKPCICTKEYAPLCNHKTGVQYGNKCEAKCAGEDPEDLTPGECPKPCACPKLYAPVCYLPKKKEYSNKCFAACDGFKGDDLTPGKCPKDPPPPPPIPGCCTKKKPVCCGDTCITKKEAARRLCPAFGKCGCKPVPVPLPKPIPVPKPSPKPSPDCICIALFDPVCSKSTGKQYGNSCEAGCAKDPGPFTKGPCADTH